MCFLILFKWPQIVCTLVLFFILHIQNYFDPGSFLCHWNLDDSIFFPFYHMFAFSDVFSFPFSQKLLCIFFIINFCKQFFSIAYLLFGHLQNCLFSLVSNSSENLAKLTCDFPFVKSEGQLISLQHLTL